MLSLATPLYLLGLALLPLIRWLHRSGRHRREVAVSHLGLWHGSAENSPAPGERRPPDPAWRRRALLAALLVVALAGPQLPQQRTQLTLWVDDSLSMLTREAQATRLAEGLAQARVLAAEFAQSDVEVRTLGDPWRSLGALDDATVAAVVAGAGRKDAAAPPAALLRRDSLHWLLTDGAHAAPFDWPGGKRADRVIRVGQVARNVGLQRLSARRNLDDPQQIDLLLKLANGGTAVETRDVVVLTDAGEVARSTQRLDPGASLLVNAVVPASASVRAMLQPGDALAEDDAITVDLSAFRRRRVATDSTCPGALVAAVAAHPALALAAESATDVAAVLDCGQPGATSAVATIRVLADRLPQRPHGPLQWSAGVAESQRFEFDTAALQLAAHMQARPADSVLLAIGDEPVLIERAGASKLIETSLDFASLASARGPQLPLLVNLMFERLLGGRLLDEISITDRGPDSSTVVPSRHVDTNPGAAAAQSAEPALHRDWAWLFLAAAVLVLLWEIAALGRKWLLLGGHRQAVAE